MDRIARKQRQRRIRATIAGSEQLPRLNVFRSANHIYAKLIDDAKGRTLLAASDLEVKKEDKKLNLAFATGKLLADKAVKKGFKKVVFDRAGYLYHGRVKALAEGAREAGLEF